MVFSLHFLWHNIKNRYLSMRISLTDMYDDVPRVEKNRFAVNEGKN